MKRLKFKVSDSGRFSAIFSVGFMALALSEWISPTLPSGRWGWLNVWANNSFGSHGYAKLLFAVGCISLCDLIFRGVIFSERSDEEQK